MKFLVVFGLAMFALVAGVCLAQESLHRPENLCSRTIEYYQEGALVNKIAEEFDREGNYTRYAGGSGQAPRETKFANAYDTKNRLIEAKQIQSDLLASKKSVEYGPKKSKTVVLDEYGYQEGERLLFRKDTAKYDEDGKLVSEERRDFTANTTGERTYAYRDDGTLKEMTQKYNGVTTKYVYKQNAKGKNSEIRTENTMGELLERSTYEWDDYGNMTDWCYYGLDGKLQERKTYKYEYDEKHNPVSATATSVMFGGIFTATAEMKFKYEFYEKK